MGNLQCIVYPIFGSIVISSYISILAIAFSLWKPANRIWPPPVRNSWKFILGWLFWGIILIGNVILVLLDWDTWMIPDGIRYFLGIPLILIGLSLFLWSFFTLSLTNTLGVQNGFVERGPYKISRNPQYLADLILFFGMGLLANSELAFITHMLAALSLWVAVPSEEDWMEERYGDTYRGYLSRTSRFL